MNTNDASLPTYVRPEVAAVAPDLTLLADLLAGTRRMHDRSAEYIQRWPDESDRVYNIRRKAAKLFEGLGRTLNAAVGMMYAKAPSMEWNQSEQQVTELWDNIDALGTKGTVFTKRFSEAAARDGLAVIMVDHTPAPDDVEVTAANERDLGLRPTWAAYPRGAVLSWRTEAVNNRTVLTQLVLYESSEGSDGAFGVRLVHRYRVLRLIDGVAFWDLYEQLKDDAAKPEDFRRVAGGTFRNRNGRTADFLPIAIGYAGRSDTPLTATIPLMGVAWVNLAHWQKSTNLSFYLDLCAFPQPCIEGELAEQPGVDGLPTPGQLRIGPAALIHLKAGGKFTWVELAGTAIAHLRNEIAELKQQIGQLGMSFLVTDTRAAETAEAKRLDAAAENSTLATAAQGIEDAVNLALEFTAWYLGIEKPGAPVLTLNKDYDSTAMDPETMKAYVAAVKDAGLPVRLLLEAWVTGGRLPADTDIDALEMDMLVEDKARRDEQEEQERLEAEAARQTEAA